MIRQLVLALALASATVVIHAVGTTCGVMPASGLWKPSAVRNTRNAVTALILLVGLLLALHFVEMALWATAFSVAGVLPSFESSLYYSLESYTTVGYGVETPAPSWRLMGPMEAVLGILMLGWSTAIIVAAVQRVYNTPAAKS